MRRFRNRGPSTAEIIRQQRVRSLLSKYGAYSRQLVSRTATSELESSSCLASSSSRTATSSRLLSSTAALQQAAISAASKRGAILHEDDDLKLSLLKTRTMVPVSQGTVPMDKGLALAAAQYVSNILSSGEASGEDSQRIKEDLLHLIERDYGIAGKDSLSLGRIKITIKRRDNDLENIRRRAEMEKAALEKSRLEESLQSRRVQSSSSQQVSTSTTKVVKTRVVKTTKRTVQTVRAA